MSREQFEKLFPVPGWMYFTAGRYTFSRTDDPITDMDRLDPALRMSFLWQGFQAAHQSRQPEIDELVEHVERLHRFASGQSVLSKSHLEHLLERSQELIAKHKGEA